MAYKEITIDFKGYRRKAKIATLPNISAVYCVYTCTYNSEDKKVLLIKLIYIGESEDLNDRINKHEKWPAWEGYLEDEEQICFSYAEVDDDYRNRAEAALIYYHKPPENTDYISSFPFDETHITTSGCNKFLESDFTVERDD